MWVVFLAFVGSGILVQGCQPTIISGSQPAEITTPVLPSVYPTSTTYKPTLAAAATLTPANTVVPIPSSTPLTTTRLIYSDSDWGYAFLYPADMFYRQWAVHGEVGDVLASTSFFTAPAEIDKSVQAGEIPVEVLANGEVSISVLANLEKTTLLDWVALRSNPENWDTLPPGATTYQIIGDVHKMTVAGREAVIFVDNFFGVYTGHLLIADGERIISILYTDHGNDQVKSAFSIIAASFQFLPSSVEPSLDTQLQMEIERFITSFPPPPYLKPNSP